MARYACRHCRADLDKGDVFEHFMSQYDDPIKAMESASRYGWSDANKVHFNRSIIVQPENSPQYVICPDCKTKDPFIEQCQ
jgi:hypothetical protein